MVSNIFDYNIRNYSYLDKTTRCPSNAHQQSQGFIQTQTSVSLLINNNQVAQE